MYNSFGSLLKLTTYGESHGQQIGGIIDGFPAGFLIDLDRLEIEMKRRVPGQSSLATPRKERDKVNFTSGIFQGKTTGAPLHFYIENTNQKTSDYDALKEVFRPSHADFTYFEKYGITPQSGGGRSSARETACRVVAGSLAKQYLSNIYGIEIKGCVIQVGQHALEDNIPIDWASVESHSSRAATPHLHLQFQDTILRAKEENDSLGGSVFCTALGVPAGLGEPIYMKLEALLAGAMMSIPASKGFEVGGGFAMCRLRGSQTNDSMHTSDGNVQFYSNFSGGIQGGISNSAPIECTVGFKPTSTIGKMQNTISITKESAQLAAKGRHDPCVVPRAVPIVESMMALVLMDCILLSKTQHLL